LLDFLTVICKHFNLAVAVFLAGFKKKRFGGSAGSKFLIKNMFQQFFKMKHLHYLHQKYFIFFMTANWAKPEL